VDHCEAGEVQRRVVLLLYATILVSEMSWSAVAPLLPTFADRFSLSASQTGVILSVASLAILAVSIPAGALTRRFGPRRLTLGAAVTMTMGNLLIGTADGYAALLVGRTVFGLGLGTLWVGGTSWLHDVSGDQRAKTLSMTSAIIGLGSLIGPGFAGIVAVRLGTGAPFVMLAGVTALVSFVLLASAPRVAHVREADEPRFRELVRAASADDMVRTSVALMFVGSILWLCSYVLVPNRLDAAGWSAADIGIAFSVSSLLYAAVSWWVARRAERAATLGIAAASTAALAASLGVVVVSASVEATVAFLLLAGIVTAVMIAITFPVGVRGPQHVPVALIGGLLNVAWAVAGLLGPPLAGAAAEAFGDRTTFSILAVFTTSVALWMFTTRRRHAVTA
jgi:MFS transporter, ACDE family, multidrug resistance protein